MANYEKMIPFILQFAAGVSGNDLTLPLEEQFGIARKRGWSDDPDDPGGATMIDVTLTTYTAYCKRKGRRAPTKSDLRAISFAEWCEILKTMYWDRCRGDEIDSQGVAEMIVDWVWASGPGVLKNVQRLLGTTPDGIVGPKTVAAINASDPSALFESLRSLRERHYRQCKGSWKYLRGWLRRLNALHL